MASVMAFLQLYQGNISFSIQIRGNPTDMFATVCQSLVETSAFMPPAHVGHGRNDMQNEDKMLDAIKANILNSIHWVGNKTGL
jgi:hypothetical protein